MPVAGAHLKLVNSAGTVTRQTESDEQGSFIVRDIDPVEYQLRAEEQTFVSVTLDISVSRGQQKQVTLQFRQPVSVSQAVSVVATAPSLLTPDPAQSIVIHDPLLDANPGRPGAPISIPGLAREAASGGTKAPQYVAPGVAGDHGEPIAQYFQIGDFLYSNNLPANPHGNGYADPNFLIPPTIEAVTLDGELFNVRQGNNSVDLAVLLRLKATLQELRPDHRRVSRRGCHGGLERFEPPKRMHGLLRRRRSVMDSWIPEVIAPARADVGFQQ
ncbi:MAG: hypothetical protein DMG76_36940 [Acidobacteria bacterium]|nr:MAG: hypothetical protein DMG76_36940 [Acidobacteriota bacterium]